MRKIKCEKRKTKNENENEKRKTKTKTKNEKRKTKTKTKNENEQQRPSYAVEIYSVRKRATLVKLGQTERSYAVKIHSVRKRITPLKINKRRGSACEFCVFVYPLRVTQNGYVSSLRNANRIRIQSAQRKPDTQNG